MLKKFSNLTQAPYVSLYTKQVDSGIPNPTKTSYLCIHATITGFETSDEFGRTIFRVLLDNMPSDVVLSLYKLNATNIQNITYSNITSYLGSIFSKIDINQQDGVVGREIDITKFVKDARNGINFSVYFTVKCECTGNISFGITDTSLYEVLVGELYNRIGNSYLHEKIAQNAGLVGIGHLNLFNEQLTFNMLNLSTSGKAPVSIGATYNENRTGIFGEHITADFEYQGMRRTKWFLLIDSIGNEYYYEATSRNDAKEKYSIKTYTTWGDLYVNLTDYTYILSTGNEVHLVNKDKSIIKFYSSSLSSGNRVDLVITQIVTKKVTITYTRNLSNKITSIKSKEDDEIKIAYNTYGFVSRIDYDKMRYVKFEYQSISSKQLLTYIKYCDNNNPTKTEIIQEITCYEYSPTSPYLLNLAYDNRIKQGYKYEYSNGKVSKITSILKNSSEIKGYINVIKSTSKTITTNHLGEESHYFFDNYGKCYLVSDKYGNVASVNYDDANIGTIPINLGKSNMARNEDNIILNPFFEGTIFGSNFKWSKLAGSTGSAISTLGYNGKPSLRIYNITSANYIITQIINVSNYKLKKLSFRGYVRGTGSLNINVSADSEMYSINIVASNNWEEIFIEDIIVPSTATLASVNILISSGSDIRLSNFSICIGEKPVRQNFLVNGCFINSNENWDLTNFGSLDYVTPVTESAPINNIFTKAMLIVGNLEKIKVMKQVINLSGSAGEELLFSLFGKVDLSLNDVCETYIEVEYQTLGIKTYNFAFNPYVKDYQLSSNSIVTESSYSKVTVGLRYRSRIDVAAYFSGFGLYKEQYGTYYNYSEKKSLTEIAQGEKGINIDSNDDSNIQRIVDATGEMYTYSYNGRGDIINIADSSGNRFDFEYDENDFLRRNEITTRNNKKTFSERTYDINGNVLTSRNYEGHLSSYDYDDKERLVTKNIPSGLVTHFAHDENDNLIKMDLDLESSLITHDYTYNANRSYNTIKVNNKSLYDFNQYDSWGNLKNVNLDNKNLNEFEYYKNGNIYTGLPLSKIYPNGSYTFSYDSLNRVTEVKYNNSVKAKFKYDVVGNLTRKEDNTGETVYSYDALGNLAKKSLEKDQNKNTFLYDYDNLGNLQQSSMELIDSGSSIKLNHNYVYDYEYNGYTTGGYFSRLDLSFLEDVIFEKPDGLYGATAVLNTVVLENDIESKRKMFKFTKNTSSLAYAVDSINQNRTDKNYGSQFFNKEEWTSSFKTYKEIFIWVRINSLSTTSVTTKIITMGSDLNEIASVSIDRYGTTSFTYNGASIGNLNIKPGEWSLIGIGLEQTEFDTKMHSSVNGSYVIRSLSGNKVVDITRILIGEYRNANTTNQQLSSGTNLAMPFEVLYAGIGAYKHDRGSYKGIYDEGYKYIFRDIVNPASGVVYYNSDVYKDMDVIPLNGSLNSAKGLKPLEYTYADSSFKINKAKLFELDRKRSIDDESYTNRHIYGSYSENIGLDGKSKSLLTYDFGIQKQGTISLRFKCNYVENWNKYSYRTILCCPSPTSGAHKLVLWINPQTQKISGGADGISIDTNLTVQPETWHLFTITWDTTGGRIDLDDQSFTFNATTQIDLTGCKTYIGSNVQNGIPSSHLTGNIEMLSYNKIKMTDIHNTIKNKGKTISILTEYDEAQRPFKKEINTGIKRLNYHYKYYDEDFKIRQAPDMEILPDGTNIVYSYDRSGNIVHQVKAKNGIAEESIHYRYDVSGRLLSEKCYNGTEFNYCYEYNYDNNGNILFKTEYNSNGTINKKDTYIYSTTIKDQLIRIDHLDSNGNITGSDYINYNTTDAFRPINYKGNDLTWEGRRLVGYGSNTYDYNSDGIRISKKVNNQTTTFTLDGNKIIKENKYGIPTYYHYDENGMLTGFHYDANEYFYIRSITGIIEKIVNSNGGIVVEYKYDAWGRVISRTGEIEILDANNFLYKGYYYDLETKLYYCNSRYYDPADGRWISADDISYLEPNNVGGLNLWAYCANNPVMNYDPSGCGWLSKALRVVAIVAAVVAVVAIVTAVTVMTAGTGTAILAAAITTAKIATAVAVVATVAANHAENVEIINEKKKEISGWDDEYLDEYISKLEPDWGVTINEKSGDISATYNPSIDKEKRIEILTAIKIKYGGKNSIYYMSAEWNFHNAFVDSKIDFLKEKANPAEFNINSKDFRFVGTIFAGSAVLMALGAL